MLPYSPAPCPQPKPEMIGRCRVSLGFLSSGALLRGLYAPDTGRESEGSPPQQRYTKGSDFNSPRILNCAGHLQLASVHPAVAERSGCCRRTERAHAEGSILLIRPVTVSSSTPGSAKGR
ncbi:hypothetical protein SKAU_G00071470 [Synaphobranchus kaupii]|uniref:Uncharacterized protein n=1 Tax=Synaphobranchus kaupii TaxID=118154 RepID=A0A9Q1G6V4_SYNKA|nr:hypothetical protein SKAU_G00071470 [Synaphobranchus kaupii]